MDVGTGSSAAGVSAADAARFCRDGYLAIEDFVSPELLGQLRQAYDGIIDGTTVARGDRLLGGLTRQVMLPCRAHPLFDRNEAVYRGIQVARILLGTDAVRRSFDMLIYKPPGHPHATPWHQDLSYARQPFAAAGTPIPHTSLQFWIALDDVDAENGCMHFASGPYSATLLEHRVAAGDPADDGRLLELVDAERQLQGARIDAVPLRAGSATVHGYGTPHYTPPNASADRPRRAYIFNIATAAVAEAISAR